MLTDEPPRPRWIETRPGVPYFLDDTGAAWTPVGHNDAITWPNLHGLFRRRDLPGVESHLRELATQGVTCLRLMLEYAQGEHRWLEKPVGRFVPAMVQLWDDLFALCERVGLHLLVTPYDTFFTWRRWHRHPMNRANGGPCADRSELLTCPAAREAVKTRLAFASDRWGGSPALFAWDLYNEMHPAHGRNDVGTFAPFIADVGPWLRAYELERHGRAHPQCVSIFGPELLNHPAAAEPIFRHPALDFATTHLYEHGTIDDPRDTVAPALAVARLMRAAIAETRDGRPVLDSEHGPIHRFKDKHKTLPAAFDEEYFRHIQWAHLASGGAGGGMRWPNRHPHVLTPGMHAEQGRLAAFLPLVDWTTFRRANLSEEVRVSDPKVAAVACGDRDQAVLWLVQRNALDAAGMLRRDRPAEVTITLPGLGPGRYRVTAFSTVAGAATGAWEADAGDALPIALTLAGDVALAVRRV